MLLVDDIVDSSWTFTLIADLLQQAGSGKVYPVALTSTASGDEWVLLKTLGPYCCLMTVLPAQTRVQYSLCLQWSGALCALAERQ